MMNPLRQTVNRLAGSLMTLIPALAGVLILLIFMLSSLGNDPLATLQGFFNGALGTNNTRNDILMAAMPMLLVASGLLLTYTAGLWNIGVEGQLMMGAIFATIIARGVTREDTSAFIVPAELLLAMLGGALWAGIVGFLRIRFGVNEIFGGVALNFIAENFMIWLLNGAWRVGNSPQTADFAQPALLARVPGTRLSLVVIAIAVIAWFVVFMALRGTRWGLQLRAMGHSQKSAFLLGVRTNRHILLAMMACGALAGLTGAIRALSFRGRLTTGISGGIGFMGVMIVLLVNVRPGWVPLVALFFGLVAVGGQQLGLAGNPAVQVDPVIGDIFQGALVLAVLLAVGVKARLAARKKG